MLKAKAGSKAQPKQRILIVEDEPDIRELYTLLLETAGFQVHMAEHALSAVCALVREKPDLILTDLRMPIVDGFSLITELRGHRDTKDIPIFVVSGLDSAEARDTAITAGANAYLTKPINPALFASQIKDFLSRSRKKPAARKRPSPKRRAGTKRK